MKHTEAAAALGLKIGDTVKILCKYPDLSNGWENVWTSSMNNFIGMTGTIRAIQDDGVFLSESAFGAYSFPCFVLEKQVACIKLRLNSEYTAQWTKGDKHVAVGCQKIPAEAVLELAKFIKKHS